MIPKYPRMISFYLGAIRNSSGIIRDNFGIAPNRPGAAGRRLDAARSGFVCFPWEEAMTQEEYEERRRGLDAQLQADVAMVHLGHEARVRSLESLWQAAKAGDEKAAIPAAVPAPPAALQAAARPPGATYNDLLEALPRLPEAFDKRDVVRVLGYKPPYTTLLRALEFLKESGEIAEDGRLGYRRSFRKV